MRVKLEVFSQQMLEAAGNWKKDSKQKHSIESLWGPHVHSDFNLPKLLVIAAWPLDGYFVSSQKIATIQLRDENADIWAFLVPQIDGRDILRSKSWSF